MKGLNGVLELARKLDGTVFLPKLNAYLETVNDEEFMDMESRKYDTGLHPSQLSGCKRKAVYKFLNTELIITPDNRPLRIDPKSRRIFNNGTGVHERLQKYFQNMGVLVGTWYCKTCESIYPQRGIEEKLKENEGKVYGTPEWTKYNKHESFDFFKLLKTCPQKCPHCGGKRFDYAEVPIYVPLLRLEGRTDGVAYIGNNLEKDIEDGNFEDFYIMEFKSENSFKFTKHSTAHENHIEQASAYSLGSQFKINKLAIMYEDKNTQDIKEFIVIVDKDRQQKLLAKLSAILESIRTRTLPEDKDITDCKYCPYTIICSGNTTYDQIKARLENLRRGNKDVNPIDSRYEELVWEI